MKKIIISLFMFNIMCVSLAQDYTLNQLIDYKGTLYFKDGKTLFSGKVVYKKDRSYYKDGRAHGKWITFYPNGNIKTIENWQNGKLYGKYILYQENGNKIFETVYLNGKDNGVYKLYHKNGNLQVEGRFSKGIPKGVWKYYSNAGKLTGRATYPDD